MLIYLPEYPVKKNVISRGSYEDLFILALGISVKVEILLSLKIIYERLRRHIERMSGCKRVVKVVENYYDVASVKHRLNNSLIAIRTDSLGVRINSVYDNGSSVNFRNYCGGVALVLIVHGVLQGANVTIVVNSRRVLDKIARKIVFNIDHFALRYDAAVCRRYDHADASGNHDQAKQRHNNFCFSCFHILLLSTVKY